MLHRRIYQFLIVYLLGIGLLFGIKLALNLSDYVIPGPAGVWQTGQAEFVRYAFDVLDTFAVAVIGQILSIAMALAVGIAGRRATWFGSFIKVAAYNVQAYPIVAIAPILFILLGDGFLTRLFIAAIDLLFPAAFIHHRHQ